MLLRVSTIKILHRTGAGRMLLLPPLLLLLRSTLVILLALDLDAHVG
jgi:hypothetical protein